MDMAQNLDASSRRKLVPVENGKPLRINDVEKDDKGASKPVSQHPNQYPSIPAKVHPNQYPSIPADASSRRKPVPVENDDGLEVLDKQNTEVHSVKSFDELPLSDQLGRGVYHMGFDEPSKVQERALPILLADPASNVILQSQYGTGKRAAALLSMIYRVDPGWKFPQGIFVSPTKELALHTGRMAEKMVKFCPEITIGYAVRGERVLRGQNVKHQILCGTPGTVLDWMLVFKVLDPTNVKIIVWDEADVMITLQGHQDQSIRIYKNLGNDCQIILLSATRTDEVIKFANTVVPDPIVIQLRQEEESLDNIKQRYVVCRNREVKFQALSNLCGIVSIGQCVVFCRVSTLTLPWR
ncbi:ATP-dependent RNA helicase DDX19A-like [Montipora foliosa]|uniref:ATP-dependent RNA helicase DDX19A-like n=1 Tax=Montipora foliosa TaxID=591990 RepID=UPI0035F1FECF